MVNSKIVYTFALAIRNERQKEYPDISEKKRDHWHTNNNQKSKEKLKRQLFLSESDKHTMESLILAQDER